MRIINGLVYGVRVVFIPVRMATSRSRSVRGARGARSAAGRGRWRRWRVRGRVRGRVRVRRRGRSRARTVPPARRRRPSSSPRRNSTSPAAAAVPRHITHFYLPLATHSRRLPSTAAALPGSSPVDFFLIHPGGWQTLYIILNFNPIFNLTRCTRIAVSDIKSCKWYRILQQVRKITTRPPPRYHMN